MTPEVIQEKLAKLEEIITTLKEFQQISRPEFTSQRTIYFGSIYALIIGIEIITDIGSHILSYNFGRKAETYKDIIKLLAETEVVPQDFADQTENMTDFRNLAIHVYARVDPKRVYDYIPQAIDQFTQYSQHFTSFISRK